MIIQLMKFVAFVVFPPLTQQSHTKSRQKDTTLFIIRGEIVSTRPEEETAWHRGQQSQLAVTMSTVFDGESERSVAP